MTLAFDHPAEPFDRDFWERDLRLAHFDATVALVDDDGERRAAVDKLLPTKRVLRIALESIGQSARGSVAQLQARLSRHPHEAVRFLLVARFAPYKLSAAVSDVAEAVLREDDLELCRLDSGEYDRLALLLRLFLVQPQTLIRVRGLSAWHRKGAAPMVLTTEPPRPAESLADFLTAERVGAVLQGASLPSDAGLHFEMAVPRRDGSHLLFLRRNLRPSYLWSDDGERIHHGNEEDLVVLHFQDRARRVRISSTTSELPRRIASLLATAYFSELCFYVDDQTEVHEAQIGNLLAAITDPMDGRLPIVELLVKNSPLRGRKRLCLCTDEVGDVIESIDDFQAQVGSLLDDVDDIVRIKVRYQGRRVSLFFPVRDGRRTVEFGDGHMDNNLADRFVAFMREEFQLAVRSTEHKGSRR